MIYYTYKVEHLPTGRYYLGKRVSKFHDATVDPYLGSGVIWRRILAAHPIHEFEKTALQYFESKKELASAEFELITQEELKNPLCQNLMTGGHGGYAANFYKTSSPKEVALKAAKTLRANPLKLEARNKKISAKAKTREDGCILAAKMRAALTVESRKKQGQSLKESNQARMTAFLLELQPFTNLPIRELEQKFSFSRTTIYRGLNRLKNGMRVW